MSTLFIVQRRCLEPGNAVKALQLGTLSTIPAFIGTLGCRSRNQLEGPYSEGVLSEGAGEC